MTAIALLTAALAGPALAADPSDRDAPTTATTGAGEPTTSAEDDAKKVVVCKYVARPGGVLDHIVIVSVNTLKGWDGSTFPWNFPDAHDSVAVRLAEKGEKAANVPLSACPTDEGEGENPVVEIVPPTIPVVDPCGTGNATYGTVPTGNYTTTRNNDGSLTLTATTGHTFPGNRPTHGYPTPVETNTTPCDDDTPPENPVVEIVPPTIPVIDPCGTGNATYGTVPTGNYTTTRNNDGSLTLTATTGHTFPGDRPTHGYPTPVETNTTPCGDVGGEVGGETEKPGEVGGVAVVAYAEPKGEVHAAASTRTEDGLPNTGGPSVALGLLGLGLTAAGAALLGSHRRSRSA
ncbi:hypothetical protein RB608_21550 [Nocardioides sp. LHD-245]|uniref:hypothetical protein n=1 Tax=Nocardioides sp. LHD-245 TaxID=3051387 RepID=UPI0027E02966|nr:hypothetical protein [Nocardioides sp. LHD-245]